MKIHLVKYAGIRNDGKTLFVNSKHWDMTAACGFSLFKSNGYKTDIKEAVEFRDNIKSNPGWVCEHCHSAFLNLMAEGKKIRSSLNPLL